jgi:hypothetical protein
MATDADATPIIIQKKRPSRKSLPTGREEVMSDYRNKLKEWLS